jgi:hypothetical protein
MGKREVAHGSLALVLDPAGHASSIEREQFAPDSGQAADKADGSKGSISHRNFDE